MSDSNRTKLSFVAESTWGTTPAASLQVLRWTGESFKYNLSTGQSSEIRDDRNISELFKNDSSVTGGFNFELSYGTYDDFMAGALCGSWSSNVLVNGTTEHYFSIERYHSDITQYFTFKGCYVNQFSLSVQAGSPITGSFEFLGKEAARGTSSSGTGYTDATTTDVMTAVSNVVEVKEGGSAISGVVVKGFDFTVNNNLRAISGVGDSGVADIGLGSCVVTGSLNMLFSSATIYDKFLNNTASSLSIRLNDNDDATDGNDYVIEFPNVKYSDATVNAGGLDTDVPINFTWQALYDSSTGGCIKITRTDET